MTQLAFELDERRVTADEEHLFRRWQAKPSIIFDELPAELGKTTSQVCGIVAGIWRKM